MSLAQNQAPSSNPNEVFVKGRKVSHSWRNGRIWVPTSELQPLLNLESPGREVDLLDALQQKGGYLWQVVDGRFEARLDPSKFSTGRPAARAHQPTTATRQANGEQTGKLFYSVREFTADTGFVRAYIAVTNDGPNDSDPTRMVCQFTDGFGKPYAEDEVVLPAMAPGASEVYEIFSMVLEQDTSMKPTADNVTCYFHSLTNPAGDPSTRVEWRKQARERKR